MPHPLLCILKVRIWAANIARLTAIHHLHQAHYFIRLEERAAFHVGIPLRPLSRISRVPFLSVTSAMRYPDPPLTTPLLVLKSKLKDEERVDPQQQRHSSHIG